MFSSGEYTNAYTNSSTEYSSLSEYNKGSQFGPPLPATVPSMAFPTLLEQGNSYGYNVLTRDSDGNTYFNVQSAYGTSCQPKYFVGKCPENKFLRPFIPDGTHHAPTACPVENEPIVEGFHPTASPQSLMHQLRALKVLFFYDGSGKCPYSRQAMNAYRQQLGGVPLDQVFAGLKDVRSFENERQMTDMKGTATPFFYSQATFRSVTGYVPDLHTLVQQLHGHVKESYSSGPHAGDMPMKLKDMNVTVYVMRGCGYCDKMKELLAKHKASHLVQWVDAMDPSRREELKHVRGFPHYKSNTTGKESTGYPGSVEKLIQHLS